MALTTVPASLSATALTLTTAAQPNITSVGTLSSLLTAAAKIKLTDTGNATVAALQITDAGLGISSPITDQMNFITADATRAVIAANGKVGIGSGATSPASLLHIDGAHSGGPIVTIHQTAGSSSADSGLDVETSSTGTYVQRWLNSGTELARVTGSGNVGIGEISPSAKFHLKNTAASTQHYDQYATAIIEDTEARLQLVASEGGSNAAGLLLTNEAKHWGVVHHGTGNSNIFSIGYYASSSSGVDLSDNLSDILNITTGGLVGIGVALPSAKLDIVGPSSTPLVLELNSANSNCDITMQSANTSSATRLRNGTNDFQVHTSGSLKLTVKSGGDVKINSGNLGIGMDAVQALDIDRTSGLSIRFYNSGTFKAGLQVANSSGQMIATSAANDFAIRSQSNLLFASGGNTERMRIASGGNVGIGTNNPLGLLTIKGTGDAIRVESTNAGVGGAQLDLLHHTASPADNDVPGALNFGGYYSGTNAAYSAAIRSEWKDVSQREGKLKFYTRNVGNFNSNMEISHNGIVGIAQLSDLNNTGGIKMYRYNIGHISNYTGNLHQITHAGIDHYEFQIQGNNTYQDLFNNVYGMGFELYIQLGDAASRDHALYSVNATSPAYGVSTFTQVYYNNGGWNTGSFTLQMIATPGDNTEYTIQAKFTSYYNSSNNATGYIQIRRAY